MVKLTKKSLLYILPIFIILAASFVFAQGFDPVDGPGNMLGNIFDILLNVLKNIGVVFSFTWLNGNVEGFLRFLWWLLVFIVLFSAGTIVFGRIYGTAGAGVARRNAGIIAAILATTTVIFTPLSMLLWLFSAYTTIMLFIFIGIAIGGILAIIYPVLGRVMTGRPLAIARIIGILLCWSILAMVTHYANDLQNVGIPASRFVILPLISFISVKQFKETIKRKED